MKNIYVLYEFKFFLYIYIYAVSVNNLSSYKISLCRVFLKYYAIVFLKFVYFVVYDRSIIIIYSTPTYIYTLIIETSLIFHMTSYT